VETGSENDQRNIRKYDLKIFNPEFGGVEKKSSKMVESRVMHHDLFNRVEQLLFDTGYPIDINDSISMAEITSGDASNIFKESFYVRCTGWPIFEDYEKMKVVAQRHNTLMDFIRHSAKSTIKDSPEYKELQAQLKDAKNQINTEKDRNKKARLKSQIKNLEKTIEGQLEDSLGGQVDQWIIDGFSHWVDTFIQDVIYFHIYPFDSFESFHLKATLKRDSFVDGDSRFTDFAYTSRPNVKLTLFGLITSIPPKGEHPFDPMREFEDHTPEDEQDDPMGFESAFRGLFRGFDGLEKFIKFDRYPNISVYPLAIFRDIYPKKLAQPSS
jgi:hypothetical protein